MQAALEESEILMNSTNISVSAGMANLTGCMLMPRTPQLWSTIFEGILSVFVGVCGLLFNCASIVILRRSHFKETFHKLLICLSVFDSLFVGKQNMPKLSFEAVKQPLSAEF